VSGYAPMNFAPTNPIANAVVYRHTAPDLRKLPEFSIELEKENR
jgi:hypothetical protein